MRNRFFGRRNLSLGIFMENKQTLKKKKKFALEEEFFPAPVAQESCHPASRGPRSLLFQDRERLQH